MSHRNNKNINDFDLIKINDSSMHKKKNDSDLGKGSYGKVKLARDRSDGKLYALKIVFFFLNLS